MIKSEFFKVQELVTKEMYYLYGEKCWQFIDSRAILTLDQLRRVFGPLTVNDWYWGGGFTESGVRSFDYGGILNRSLHKFGCAFDVKSKTVTADEMRSYIINNIHEFPYLVGLEMDVDWLHFDVRNREGNMCNGQVFAFSPN